MLLSRSDSTRYSCSVKFRCWPAAPRPGGPAPWRTLRAVAKVVVDVMLKPEIRDPQGEAIVGACHRLGFTDVRSVRQGKRFEVEIDDGQDPAARTAELAAELLANPVIEEFIISSPHGG